MSERRCKKCGSIEFGKWGTLGIIGYSLFIGCMGFALGRLFFTLWFPWIWVIMISGVIFWLPMFFISAKLQREMKKAEVIEND